VTQRLKRLAICAAIVFLLGLLVAVSAQRPSEIVSVPFSPAPYRVGERLTYNVSFSNFISAAHVELRVVSRGSFFGREAIQLRGHVKTTGVVNVALMALNNDYITYVDPSNGQPFRSQQTIREATRTLDSARDFNQAAGLAAIPSKQRGGEFPGTYDFVSIIYRLRALPLAQGATYYFVVRGDNKDYQAELKVVGHQNLKTNVGSFNTIVSQVRVKNDSQADDYDLRLYFSDDERHVPVLITAKLRAGEIRAELAGSEFVQPVAQLTPTPTPAPQVVVGSQTPITVGPSTASNDLEGLPFKVGEQLNYQIYLATLPEAAGTATFHVRGRSRYFDRDGLLLSLQAQTTNAAQRLFFASDQITSYVDVRALLPYRVEMKLIEGRRRLNQTLTINQDHGSAMSEGGERIDIPVGTHEFVSFFYALRTFNLTPPRRNAISLLVNNEPKTLFITAVEKEVIQLAGQSIPAIKISLTTDDPQPDKYQFRGWISDDGRRLPLRLQANTEIGPVRADLAIIPLTYQ
jgi:hypothetical protein